MANKTKNRQSALDCTLIGTLALGSTLILGWLGLAPLDARNGVAVIFPPWIGSADAVTRAAAAGASLVRMGRYPFIVVVHPQGEGYLRRVMGDGAWAVLDPQGFGGCLARKVHPS